MSKDSSQDGLSGEVIRIFYELWEGSVAGREYLESVPTIPSSLEKLPHSSGGDVNRA